MQTSEVDVRQFAHQLILVKSALSDSRRQLETWARTVFMPPWGRWLSKQIAVVRKGGPVFASEQDKEKIADALQIILTVSSEEGAITGLDSLGFRGALKPLFKRKAAADVIFELTNDEILWWIRHRAETVSGWVLSHAVRDSLQLIDSTLTMEGTIDEARDRVGKYLGEDLFGWKSFQIVNTEVHAGLSNARHEMYVRSGVELKGWLTVGDNRVRQSHRANEEQGFIPIHQLFQNGAMHPGDGPDSVGCRCAEQVDLSDPNIILEPWDGS